MAGSFSAFTALMQSAIAGGIDNAADQIKDIVQDNVDAYYGEYSPRIYERTGQFQNSPRRTPIAGSSGGASAEIFIDTSAMDYSSTKYPPAPSGLQVVSWAASGQHGVGGLQSGAPFWDNALKQVEESGVMTTQFLAYLRSLGFDIG